MDLRKKFLKKVRPIFGKTSFGVEHPLQIKISRQNTDHQQPDDHQGADVIEKVPEIRDVNLNTSDNYDHRGAASSDKVREPANSTGRPSMKQSLYGSIGFGGVTNSGISIGGGTVNVSNITNNNLTDRITGLELLKRRVATSAFHNSVQRVDPPRCHPDTRVAIQQLIHDWILMDLIIRQTWIMWMHGAAGGGKSAIMQSIAECCEKAKILLASFFFFRTDPTRNSLTSFIATVVYQVIQKIPQTRDEILMIIENNPLIFDESLESQLDKLVIRPLLRLRDSFKDFFVILIDGLDECIERAHQSDLIKLLGTISRSKTIPIVFLVASRREPQIEAAFVRKQVSDLVTTLPLDNSDIEQTSDDIRRFLNDKFHDITETHLRRHLLSSDWPPPSAVEEIMTKSSGQFIYASVVINYISSPRNNPAHLLDIVRGIRLQDPSSLNPFAHLDALYQHIFSQVEALDQVLDILAFILISRTYEIASIEGPFLLEHGGLEICLADLTAVVECDSDDRVKFLHASLPDFLRDETRSERYHIDIEKYLPKLLCMIIDRYPLPQGSMYRSDAEYSRLCAIESLLDAGVRASDQLQRSLMSFRFTFGNGLATSTLMRVAAILKSLQKLNFDHTEQAYHYVLDVFATGLVEFRTTINNSFLLKKEIERTDLWARVNQICQEL